ncbi:hypothetical protein Tco_0708074 [Tanacetum coccineum]
MIPPTPPRRQLCLLLDHHIIISSLAVGSSSPILILCYLVNVDRMAPKRTSTSAAPTMTQAAIKKLVADSVAIALEAQTAIKANMTLQ